MFFCGRTGNVKYPAPVKLDGKDLPWVEHAEHLGHTLHQSVTMEMDSNRARAKFIDKTVDVRDQFAFAHPRQQLQMIQLLCCDGYGSMLWELQSTNAEQFFRKLKHHSEAGVGSTQEYVYIPCGGILCW
jgi:hypothetical protein